MSSETILAEMIQQIDSKYDTSKGSIIYDILNAGAIKFAQFEESINSMVEKRFGSTANGKDLHYVVADYGITPITSTRATGRVTIKGVVGAQIKVGDLVSTDKLQFEFTEAVTIPASGTVTVAVRCTTYGTVGNVPAGAIKYFPKTLTGLQTVTNELAFVDGINSEDDDELRARFLEKVQEPATSGNDAEYRKWARDVAGVADARVFECWNGNGTVKVTILNNNKRAADQTLITSVKNYIESVRPVGATVTVNTVTEVAMNIKVTLSIKTGYTLTEVKSTIEQNITDYLKEIAFNQDVVSYANIGSIIFNSEGVADYTGYTLNNGTDRVLINSTQVAVLGVVTLE